MQPKKLDYGAMRPYFGWAPADIVKFTLENTTQLARESLYGHTLRKHYRTRFPALNVPRRHEPVATDTVFSDTPAIDNGAKHAQISLRQRICLYSGR